MTDLTLVYNFSKFLDQSLFFLINGNTIDDVQDWGKIPEVKHRFIMCNIIEMIEGR